MKERGSKQQSIICMPGELAEVEHLVVVIVVYRSSTAALDVSSVSGTQKQSHTTRLQYRCTLVRSQGSTTAVEL